VEKQLPLFSPNLQIERHALPQCSQNSLCSEARKREPSPNPTDATQGRAIIAYPVEPRCSSDIIAECICGANSCLTISRKFWFAVLGNGAADQRRDCAVPPRVVHNVALRWSVFAHWHLRNASLMSRNRPLMGEIPHCSACDRSRFRTNRERSAIGPQTRAYV